MLCEDKGIKLRLDTRMSVKINHIMPQDHKCLIINTNEAKAKFKATIWESENKFQNEGKSIFNGQRYRMKMQRKVLSLL